MSPLMSADRGLLIGGQLPLEGVFELLLPVRVGAERMARHRFPCSVELEQLLRHIAHRLLDARFGFLPRRPTEPIERGPRRAGVHLNEIEPLDRDEQFVLARIPELHELLRISSDVDALEADEQPDAVIDVDDEVAGLQIAEIGKERAGGGLAAFVDLALFLEDVGLGPELKLRIRQTEPAAQMTDADQHGGGVRLFAALDRHGEDLVVGEQFDRPLRSTRRVRDEHERLAAFASALDLFDPVLQATAKLHGRLTGDVVDARFRFTEGRGLERRGGAEPVGNRVPPDHQL